MTELEIEEMRPCKVHGTDAVPVVRLEQVDELIREAVWAMEMVREAQEIWSDRVAKAHVQRCDAFLASPLVAEWRKRQEEGSAQ